MPSFVDREAATELGVRPARWELLFFLLLGLVVAAASKVAGALMVFCYLIAPAAAALLLVRRLWSVLILAAVLAVTSTLSGLWLSFRCDWPTNQTVCLVACVLLPVTGLALAVRRLFRWQA
jgi:zinc transport system permease protein